MTCRSCGTEIADKAIVCYRCGTPTAVTAPSPSRAARPGRAWYWRVVHAGVLGLVAWGVAAGPAWNWTRAATGLGILAAYFAIVLVLGRRRR